ncbi:MAG: tetratricopeptide repeat protein [Deltaproteobacteria bacterium]|nr:tetratricopeptide repeat protein [Deltaproteobacteria bacterium]MBW1718963.1 tetratricopeptide repeat protein [Deltaproteobacteria bacterium]MBW1931923.1 tetratricopeptide repeat protein [Deltaproteobacteria bacterium]MBW1937275.1 tetratricopeptide repeat protein [Deltaproteobacteria bacterium]MBW1963728.1 tetratricopeptide repeat protein [Deltaproteobacteria bacterium]
MKRSICLSIAIFFMVCFFGPDIIALQTSESEELFFSSNQAYRQGHFQEAIDGYDQLIRSGHKDGNFYYNLGNAYFRLDQLGRAILNYERARLLMPGDADLNFNLSYARDKTLDDVSESQDLVSMTFFWLKDLSLGELLLCFAILNFLFWTAFLIRLFFKFEWTYYVSIISLILWIIAGTSFGLKWSQLNTDNRAVILEQEVNILAGPDMRDTVLFKLHAGTIVHYERSEDGWSLVSLPDKKRGWVKAGSVEPVITEANGSLALLKTGA